MSVQLTYCAHSTSCDNERGLASGWLAGELSASRRRQAVELGEALRGRGFHAVYASDLRRAVETVQIALPATPFAADSRLRECDYGGLNGAPARVVRAAEREHIEDPFPGGESYRDVEARVAAFTAMLRRAHEGERVLVVSHMAPQLSLDVIVNGVTWPQAFDSE